jgi:voltage-gated potassium channel
VTHGSAWVPRARPRPRQHGRVDPALAFPAVPAPGAPRSEADAAKLARFEHWMRLPIVASALLPLVIVPSKGNPVTVAVGIVSWLVFLLDFLVTRHRLVRYVSTGLGKFDLVIVILTAPWFLLPGASAGGIVVVLRLARVVRLVVVTRGARRLVDRLGRVVVIALGVLVVATAVAYYAEHPTNPGFATYEDSLWWGIVTLTTVGYGDIVPETNTGRWAGVAIMITGVAVLGVLAGSLASFFRLDAGKTQTAGGSDEPEPTVAAAPAASAEPASYTDLVGEVARLRDQIAELADRMGPRD